MKPETKTKLLNRLSRMEGQVRGVAGMVTQDRHAVEVLTQVQAVRGALARVEAEVLAEHLEQCVHGSLSGGDADERRRKADELIDLLGRALR